MTRSWRDVLNDVLYRRGEPLSAYAEGSKHCISEHASELVQGYPSLILKPLLQNYNGRQVLQLQAEGTIPINFQGAQFHIPVQIYIPTNYPYAAPSIYVTPDLKVMTFATNHPDLQLIPNQPLASVSTPSMKSWAFPTSTLLGTVTEVAIRFGERTPVFSIPKPSYQTPQPSTSSPGGVQPTTFNPMLQHQQSYGQTSTLQPRPSQPQAAGPSMMSHPLYAAYSSAQGQFPPQTQPPSSSGFAYNPNHPGTQPVAVGPSAEELEKARQQECEAKFVETATAALVIRAQSAAQAFHKHAASEVERLERVKFALHEKYAQYQLGMRSLQDERAQCEDMVRAVATKSQQLKQWLDANEWKKPPEGTPVNPNLGIMPVDTASRQLLMSHAEDLAIDDALVVLDELLNKGSIKPEVWLKQVRLLSKRQFFTRALSIKLSDQQSQPPPHPLPIGHGMPMRPPPPPMMPSQPSGVSDRIQPYPAPPPRPTSPPNYMNPLTSR